MFFSLTGLHLGTKLENVPGICPVLRDYCRLKHWLISRMVYRAGDAYL